MLLDPSYLLSHAGQIAVVVALTFLGKFVILAGIARSFGYINMAPWIIGLGLSQIGEFSFVLARTGLTSGLLSKATYDLALTCTVATMALSPLVSTLALPLGRLWTRSRKPSQIIEAVYAVKPKLDGHVVVAGGGRTGWTMTRVLKRANVEAVVVELSHAVYRELSKDGISAVWGDAATESVLNAAKISHARVLLLTIPDQNTTHLVVERARALNPHIAVIARANYPDQIADLRKLGVHEVVQPEFEGGVEMVRQVLGMCRQDGSDATRLTEDARSEFYSGSFA
jgi:CPA2 family monovalent cation:H+ antiporter-2